MLNIMKGDLSTLRARIHLRLIQLGFRDQRRARIVNVVGRVNSIPRLTAFTTHLESRCQAGQPPARTTGGPPPLAGEHPDSTGAWQAVSPITQLQLVSGRARIPSPHRGRGKAVLAQETGSLDAALR